jgi:hypothetical protein
MTPSDGIDSTAGQQEESAQSIVSSSRYGDANVTGLNIFADLIGGL